MSQNSKIAIIGNKDTILGFKALGLETFDANDTEGAIKILKRLTMAEKNEKTTEKNDDQSAYAIVFIMEEFAQNIPKDEYKKLSSNPLPAIIPIPSNKGTNGYGIKRIGKMVEQAVGSDIFKE